MAYERFDAIVIGSGQAGNPLAAALAAAGKRTAVIESKHVGGTCVNEGCTPTKTMVTSGRVAYLARRGADYGIHANGVSVDMARVRERKRAIVESFRGGSQKRLESTEGIELIFGVGEFVGPKAVRLSLNGGGERLLEAADWVFVNTGCRAAVPAIEGLADVPYLDNISVMELGEVPEHLIVLGGGYIGLEFGQLFRRLGARVTVVQSGRKLLEREDDDISEEVRKLLVEDGVNVLLETHVSRVAKAGNGVALTLSGGGAERKVEGSHLLVAVGRTPNTERLNLPAAGIAVDAHGFIQVDEFLETTAKGVYALGDVKGGPEFTHISYDDYRVAAANTIGGERRSIARRMVPYTVFLDPQLGRIGMTETQARAAGRKVKVGKMATSSVARALETDETRGVLKVVVDAETEEILGAAMLAVEGGELASMIQIAMMGKLKASALRDGIWSHPTWSECLNNLFAKLS